MGAKWSTCTRPLVHHAAKSTAPASDPLRNRCVKAGSEPGGNVPKRERARHQGAGRVPDNMQMGRTTFPRFVPALLLSPSFNCPLIPTKTMCFLTLPIAVRVVS